QGVGPWELNLAGFLADLNTNYWGKPSYAFDPFNSKVPSAIATGTAFDDAREFLRYRYTPPSFGTNEPVATHQTFLYKFTSLFPGTGPGSSEDLFRSDFIDGYANTFATPFGTTPLVDDDDPDQPWPGADSKRHYFTLHDLFDGNKLKAARGFRYKLSQASARG